MIKESIHQENKMIINATHIITELQNTRGKVDLKETSSITAGASTLSVLGRGRGWRSVGTWKT